jgi:hypothetical protein
MSLMRTLERPETVETRHGLKKVTHEVYCYAITPFQNPPIKVLVYKGNMNGLGHLEVLTETQASLDLTQEEFKLLLDPTPAGKPAGDFRLSDVMSVLNRRFKKNPA